MVVCSGVHGCKAVAVAVKLARTAHFMRMKMKGIFPTNNEWYLRVPVPPTEYRYGVPYVRIFEYRYLTVGNGILMKGVFPTNNIVEYRYMVHRTNVRILYS